MGRKGKKKPSGDSGPAGDAPKPGTSATSGDGLPPQQPQGGERQEGAPVWRAGRGRGSGPQQQGPQQRPGQGPPPVGAFQVQPRPAWQPQGQQPAQAQQQRTPWGAQQQTPFQQQEKPAGPSQVQQPVQQQQKSAWQQKQPQQQQKPVGQQQQQQRPVAQQQQQQRPVAQQQQQQRPVAQQQHQQRPVSQQQQQKPVGQQQQQPGPQWRKEPFPVQQQAQAQQQKQQQPQQRQPRQAGDRASPPTKEMARMSVVDEPFPTTKQSSPTKSSIPDHLARALVEKIPLRKTEGKTGRPIQVFVNMMEIKFGPNFRTDIVHYDIVFNPETPRYLIRPAFQALQQQHFPTRHPAFDGRKNVFSAGRLPFGDTMEHDVEVHNEDGRPKSFKITMNKVNEIDLKWLKNVRRGYPEGERDIISVQALDIILRQAPYQNLCVTPVGRSFFSQPRGRPVDLGNGLELWVGLFQSAVLGWKPYLNVDVAHKGFPKPQAVLDAMGELCRSNGVPTAQEVNNNREEIERYLRKLKVTCMIPNQPDSRRTYTINGLVRCARDNFFEHNGNRVSVEHYFQIEKKYRIRYTDIPCLHVGPHQKNIHVPAELCTILSGQATNKKMNELQTSNMIRQAATPADARRQKILDTFNAVRHNHSPCMKEFGLSIGGEFEKVNARVLNAPTLTYNEQDRDVRVMKGVWRASRFNVGKDLPDESWTILNLDNRTREDALRNLEQLLRGGASSLGMNIGRAVTPYAQMQPPTRNLQEIIKFFNEAKARKLRLVFVVVPDRPPNVYSKVKQVAELNVGVLTQCLKSFTVQRKLNPATVGNILLKVNAKLDGVNHTLHKTSKPRCLFEPCMIVGADVTHPAPDAMGIPSIAAVAASHDPKAFKYHIEIRLQPPRAEIIQHLEEIMIIQLKTFYQKTSHKPRRIIFYRDGVSEGQFPQVMHHELTAIRNACRKVEPGYEPPISFFVVQKRHHIRLFPADARNSDDRNGNVQAGTIVDTEITHPSHIDFYLVSHASIQGTARPTKYRCLWDDNKMSEDEIEQLTYYLCHMFSRCTRSVSYPTPTYYAHLAAFRARALTQDVNIDVNNLENEQKRKLTIKEDFLNNPMFFV
ncbi:protein argonaute-2-like [Belonocnema kinseyi]|uniref:protein argonaute-2-like n=1 Tax=Belonocnema kinseyi TaxID=2817044 RepID=UPI00143CF2B0|nr:protein argonaute-2-like [Belonocnema kinseyi]